MDEPLEKELAIDGELLELVTQAEKTYQEHFNGETWLGRCIFLSFYCSVNTCDFCFRSVADKRVQDPAKALRSLPSVLAEALLIKANHWRIEFLTGGYGIDAPEKIARMTRLVKGILGEKIWLNLGVLPSGQLEALQDAVGGIVASVETLEPQLHEKTCPDKPIAPYERMLEQAKTMGYARSITLVIGLGEQKEDWRLVESFIKKHELERITLYALRPVKGTSYEHGPTPQELAWWIAKTRIAFPQIEIIAGTAEYRLPEVPLLLRAGANALTKLPATKMYNTERAEELRRYVESAGRTWTSTLTDPEIMTRMNWDETIASLDLTQEEKAKTKTVLADYLRNMSRKTKSKERTESMRSRASASSMENHPHSETSSFGLISVEEVRAAKSTKTISKEGS